MMTLAWNGLKYVVYFESTCLNSWLCEQYDQQNAGYFQVLNSSLLSNNESEKCSAFKWKPWLIMYD